MPRRNRKFINCEGQLSFFDIDVFGEEISIDDKLELFRHGDVKNYVTKTIKHGELLDCEIFPDLNAKGINHLKEKKPSSEAQEKLNHNNVKKNITRYANQNFTSADIWGTFGYDDPNLPADERAAQKNITNFLRRIKRLRKKLGLPALRYIYVTEFHQDGEKVRCHHHVIMSGDLSRDEIEKLWKGGAYPQTRRLRVKHDTGLTGLANYLAKGKNYERKWGKSTNLKPPVITYAEKKVTKRRAEKIASNENLMPEIFEKLYPGYAFYSAEVKRSDYCAGVYIYAQMYRKISGG